MTGQEGGGPAPGTAEEQFLEGKVYGALYRNLKGRILGTFELRSQPTRIYMGFYSKVNNHLICAVHFRSRLVLEYTITKVGVIPESRFVKRRSNKKYESYIESEADIDRAIDLVDRVFRRKGA